MKLLILAQVNTVDDLKIIIDKLKIQTIMTIEQVTVSGEVALI